MGKRSGSGCCTLPDSPTIQLRAATIIVKLVGEGASRASAKNRAHGNDMIFFFNILMNGIVGETSERKSPAGKKNFNFVGRRQFLMRSKTSAA